MSRVASIKNPVKDLSPEELAAFCEWFAQFDAETWDREFEADVKAGKLDNLVPHGSEKRVLGSMRGRITAEKSWDAPIDDREAEEHFGL